MTDTDDKDKQLIFIHRIREGGPNNMLEVNV